MHPMVLRHVARHDMRGFLTMAALYEYLLQMPNAAVFLMAYLEQECRGALVPLPSTSVHTGVALFCSPITLYTRIELY